MSILKKLMEVLSDDDYNALVDYIDSQYSAGWQEGYSEGMSQGYTEGYEAHE